MSSFEFPNDYIGEGLHGVEIYYEDPVLENVHMKKGKPKNGDSGGGSHDGWHEEVLERERLRRADLEADGRTFPDPSGEGWRVRIIEDERARRAEFDGGFNDGFC